MKKITEGLVRNRGITWFPNLIDKRKTQWSANIHVYVHPHSVGVYLLHVVIRMFISIYRRFIGVHYLGRSIKIHLYWAMKNCSQDPDQLREFVFNIPDHYKVHVYMLPCDSGTSFGILLSELGLCT